MVKTKKKIELGKNSLYSAFPIPAYKLLIKNGEILATKILTELVSYLGDSNEVFPKIETMAENLGVSKNSVIKGLTVLYEYEFVAKVKKRTGRHFKNFYYIQESAYKDSLFSGKAQSTQQKLGICAECGKRVSRSDVGEWGETEDFAHWGCGGKVLKFSKTYKPMVRMQADTMPKVINPSAEDSMKVSITEKDSMAGTENISLVLT